jgi:ribosome assembly protein RRB1
MPLKNNKFKRSGQPSNKKRIVTSSRFNDSEEKVAIPANVVEQEQEEEEEEWNNKNDEEAYITSEEDVTDDEQQYSDEEEDENVLLGQIEQMNIETKHFANEEEKEKFYLELIQKVQHIQKGKMALDYDYQEADDDETLNGVTRTKDNIAIYNPKKYRLAEDEELDYSNEAYTMFHRLNVEWPCLSFDIINDLMGLYRTEFPMTSYIVAGSQASQNFQNRLYVLKMSNLLKTQNDSDSEYEDEEENEEESDEYDSDQESVEKRKSKSSQNKAATLKTSEPILEHLYIPLNAEVNRVRCMPQNTRICALMCSDATLRIFDIQSQFDLLNRDVNNANSKIPITGRRDPLKILKSHKNEGFALDWSSVQQGRLGSGDFDANISVHNMQNDGSWKLLNNYKRHSKSVEDIQWSPIESNVFASCSCDGKVMIWDIRQPRKEGLSFVVSKNDVNVISWNKIKQNQIATGDDNGIVTVWDMKAIATGGSDKFVAQYNYLEDEHVTSIEWHPTDESIFVVSTDNRITIWDLSLEKDLEAKDAMQEENDNVLEDNNSDFPAQLRFEHFGRNIKEVHWSLCLKDVLLCTGEMGIQIWKPSIEL